MTQPQLSPVRFSRAEIETVLHAYAKHMLLYLVDEHYYCLTADEWKEVIAAVGVDPVKYAADTYDCDSFSRYWWAEINHRFKVNGMLTVVDFSGEHSYNLLLVNDGGKIVPRLFEPQTLLQPAKGSPHYTMRHGFLF